MTELTHKDTMSSREIARIIGKPHNDVMKSIRNMEEAWQKVNEGNFSLVKYRDSKGEMRPEYQLNKIECLYIATKFNNEARARLIVRWAELEEKTRENRESLILEYPQYSYREQAKERQRELMRIIRSYLKQGDITNVAKEIAKPYYTVKSVLNCHYRNEEIIQALYERALKNKQAVLIDYNTMIQELKK